MFKEETSRWIKHLQDQGKLAEHDKEALGRLADAYAIKLEEYFNEAVRQQLAPTGKLADFEKMLLYDTQYTTKFLNQAIPGFPGFKEEIFRKARKEITGT